jgi:4-amino-4-deoxy-L-arabinose transferase-like glycosyltransferase
MASAAGAEAAAPQPRHGRPAFAFRGLVGLGAAVALLLVSLAHGYGYHRDELYFLVAGNHLDWAYPDQGPLTPFLAWAMNTLGPGSLTVLRLPSAVMAAGVVLLAGALAFELGGSKRAQLIAASCGAVASVVLVVGHLLSTTTFDLLAWAAVTWLVARLLRTDDQRLWVPAGLAAGLALLNKPLMVFLLAALGAGLVIAGPRRQLRSPWLWAGLSVAALLWLPWLLWQGAHGWPQLAVSASIARGGSVSSQPRWAPLPFQLLLVSPVLAPVWIAGLVALFRRSGFRSFRLFAVAWLFLVVVFSITAGKPYYLAGMFPVLLAAGAIEADTWLERGARAWRAPVLWAAVLVSGVVSAFIALPILPASDAAAAIALNPDVGETIGWPELVQTVADVYHQAGGQAVLFTANYGEAGALDRYGPGLGLPPAYSGHNAFAEWGTPPDRSGPVVVVGLAAAQLDRDFQGCDLAARVSNAAGIHNQERGKAVYVCTGTRAPWSQIWPDLQHLG